MLLKQTVRVRVWSCLLLIMTTLLVGCSSKKTGTAHGRVTINGQPVTTGRIEFNSQEQDLVINADIKEDGSYIAKTYDTKGLPPGKYRIAVHSTPLSTGNESLMTPANMPKQSLVPQKYQNAATSELIVTVQEGENSPFNFELGTN